MTETTQIETPNPESFAALFEASATRTDQLREGDIVAGTILKVSKDTVVVDIGYKSEGVISLHEFTRRRPTSSRSGMRSAPRASVTS